MLASWRRALDLADVSAIITTNESPSETRRLFLLGEPVRDAFVFYALED